MKKTMEQRFWEKVDMCGADECWGWTSAFGTRGYGVFWVGGEKRSAFAHRVSYELHHGKAVPKGMLVLHSCDNPACVNPVHLRAGTASDNSRDAVIRGRARCCKQQGVNNHMNKLTEHQVMRIRILDGALSDRRVAEAMGVERTSVRNIRRAKIWNHLNPIPGNRWGL